VEVEAAPEPAEEDDQEEDEDAIRSPAPRRARETDSLRFVSGSDCGSAKIRPRFCLYKLDLGLV
jgi:hypothetical protein